MKHNSSSQSGLSQRIPKQAISWILGAIIRLPISWLLACIAFALLSLFEITWTEKNGLTINFQVTEITVLFFIVIWLPTVLQIFALVGGAIKTPAGEFSSPGIEDLLQIIDPEMKGEAVGALKVVLEKAEETVSSQKLPEVRQLHQKLNQEYVNDLSPEEARQELNRMGERYQELTGSPSGTKRNFMMEAIAGAMRGLAPKADLSQTQIKTHLQAENTGQRMIGLSCAIAKPESSQFPFILEAIAAPKFPLEQEQALQVMEILLPSLTPEQKQKLKQILEEKRNLKQPRKDRILPESQRWMISDRLLASL